MMRSVIVLMGFLAAGTATATEVRGKAGAETVPPVTARPLSVSNAAMPKLVPVSGKPVPPRRVANAASLVGRWAKADPATRTPLDDCRTSYLEMTRDDGIRLHDPRIEGLPLEGRLDLGEGSPAQGVSFGKGEGPSGRLRLEPAESARLDRLFLQLERPFVFGATFVRCR